MTEHEHRWFVNSWGIAWVEEFCADCFTTRRRDRLPGEKPHEAPSPFDSTPESPVG